MSDLSLSRQIQAMPKAEIHVHLEGAIQPATLFELAKRHHRLDALPAHDAAGLHAAYQFENFSKFIKLYLLISDLLRTPEDFATIVESCGADMAAQNIRYRELTFTPYTHADYQNKRLTIDDLLEGLDAGREVARRRYGVEMRWVFDVPRNYAFEQRERGYDPGVARRTLEYALRGMAHGVVGLAWAGLKQGRRRSHLPRNLRLRKPPV
ncbi:MAG: hypothetical protein IPK16_01045 [Anaerolineales bacterium]|nr:hypothetical protein [Anaerolineales bacterium]